MTALSICRWIGLALLLAGTYVHASTTATPSSEKRKENPPVSAALEWLPPIQYSHEPLPVTIGFHNNENFPKTASLEIAKTGLDGKIIKGKNDKNETLTLSPGKKLIVRKLNPAALSRVRILVTEKEEELFSVSILIVRPTNPFPKHKILNGRFVNFETGEHLVFITKRREAKPNRDWAPLKQLLGKSSGAKNQSSGSQHSFLFLPGSLGIFIWDKNKKNQTLDFGELLPKELRQNKHFLAFGPYRTKGGIPILSTFSDVGNLPANPTPNTVVVWLPPNDLTAPTDPNLYKLSVEFLLSQLAAKGVKRVALIPPVQFGIPAKRHHLLEKQVQSAAQTYGARLIKLQDILNEEYWLMDGVTPPRTKIYGTRLNRKGRKKIGSQLTDMVK